PRAVVKRADGERHEPQGENRARRRDIGPRPQPQELPRLVVFDPQEQSGGPEAPPPHLQVPAVMLATQKHTGALRPEGGFNGPEPLVRSPPVLAPQGGRRGPERRRVWRAAAAPGCEALVEPPPQAGERLEQMERRRHQPPFQPGR